MRLASRICPMALLILCAPCEARYIAFKVNLGPAQVFRQPLGMVQRRGSSDEFAQIIIQPSLKFRILLGTKIFLLQLAQRMHQSLGHIPSSVRTKPAGRIG